MNQIAKQAHLSRLLFEGGARSYGAHVLGLQRLYQLHWVFAGIHQDIQRPGTRELTSAELNVRASRRADIARTIKLRGGQVGRDYR